MKTVKLKSIHLRNFKKIQDLKIEFSDNTQILGKNRAGKTTIADAYSWLLYGKNQSDSQNFSIKTLDENNNALPQLEHGVLGVFDVDGKEYSFERIYREKWVKKRGSEVSELTGHETNYFVNGVPIAAAEYQKQVSNMIDETVAKLISNTTYFNSIMDWKKRRETLEIMAGSATDQDVINQCSQTSEIEEVVKLINEGKSLEGEKRRIASEKTRLNDELKQIPSRLDENQRMTPEALPFPEIEREIEIKESELTELNKQLSDSNAYMDSQKAEIFEKQKEKSDLQIKLNQLELENRSNSAKEASEVEQIIKNLQNEIQQVNNEVLRIQREITSNDQKISIYSSENSNLRSQYEAVTLEQFQIDPKELSCPTCKRELNNSDNIEDELRSNFNKDKLQRLESIKLRGNNNKLRILELEAQNLQLKELYSKLPDVQISNDQIEQQKVNLTRLKNKTITDTPEIIELKNRIENFVLPQIQLSNQNETVNSEIKSLRDRISELKSKLTIKDSIQRSKQREIELKERQRFLAQEIATLEKIEMQIGLFTKIKIDQIESIVNSKFSLIKWKMFKTQLNGGVEEMCEATVNGVPWNDLNTELQVNAGLDCINALSYHFGIFAPVFIDGRESVTTIINTSSQVISLVVNSEMENLTVVN